MNAVARWCFSHRRLVVATWLAAVTVITTLSVMLGSAYTADFDLPESEARRAQALLERDFPEQAAAANTIVIRANRGKLTDREAFDRIEPVFVEIRGMPRVEFVSSFYGEGNQDQISADGTVGYAQLQIQIPDSGTPTADVERIMDAAEKIESDDFDVEFGGKAIQDTIEPVPGLSEGLGIVGAGIVLFLAFGSLVTMSLPLITATASLGVSLALVGLLSHVISLPSFAPALAGLMGLGVGIDYALFIVSRHQQALGRGREPSEALRVAAITSGRSVVFAGVVVGAALCGLVALGIGFVTGLALAAAIAVLMTMVASLTLLPALLGFLGDKARSRKQRASLPNTTERDDGAIRSTSWYRWAKRIERRPAAWLATGLAAMLILSVPLASMRLGASDEGNDARSATTRKAYDLLAEAFGPGHNGPLLLVTPFDSPRDFNTFTNFADAITGTAGVVSISQPMTSSNGRSAVLLVYPATSPQSAETSELIERLREEVIPRAASQFGITVYVGGQTASFDDFGHVVTEKFPMFVLIVLLLSFLLLVIVFRSLLIPLKATLMNLLTMGASFGVVVAVFQWGWGGEQIGGGQGPIESFVPVILFAITFGLSMDYEVFIVSRMHEEWDRGHDNSEAIALGQAATGRLVTAAAMIMVLVFASFVLGADRIIKLFGVGLTAAILLDALVVRAVLVPASMHLFGRANWWLPEWLDRRLPASPFEGSGEPSAR